MPSLLVTGASTGIGRALAAHLASLDYSVFAGVRHLADAPPDTQPILLDVTDAKHVEAAATALAREDVCAVINNAGHNYISPFEFSGDASARALMEVNFFGLANLTRALIPHLRRYAEGHPGRTAKLINISSIGGLIGIPWESFYHASKFAVVGLTEALRAELWSQNIRASVVCPGGVRTEFLPKTRQGLQAAAEALPAHAHRSYTRGLERFASLFAAAERLGSEPAQVARAVAGILRQRDPALRHVSGVDAQILFALSRALPQRVFGKLLRLQFASS